MKNTEKELSNKKFEEYKGLKNGQVERCKEAFKSFLGNKSGGQELIQIAELEAALINMGHKPTEEELYRMINEDNEEGEDGISLTRFLNIIAKQKRIIEEKMRPDLIDTYLALGGKLDSNGEPDNENGKLELPVVREKIKQLFNIDLDLDRIAAISPITFDEFMDIMSG